MDIRFSKCFGRVLGTDATGSDSPSMARLRLFRTSCPKIAVVSYKTSRKSNIRHNPTPNTIPWYRFYILEQARPALHAKIRYLALRAHLFHADLRCQRCLSDRPHAGCTNEYGRFIGMISTRKPEIFICAACPATYKDTPSHLTLWK